MPVIDDEQLKALLEFLKRERGFDFTGYKRASLQRRVTKRMEAVGAEDCAAYLERLEVDAGEFERLFDTILINVTSFFRDPAAWEALRERVLPDLLERIGNEQPIRVWCAACASGEETYSIAIALAEALGEAAYGARVKIYATDADPSALAVARSGTYPLKALDGLGEARVARFFEGTGATRSFRKDLRRSIIFGRNDLVQDAPIGRVDLLSCRNALMYFNAETQAGVLRRFHFALRDTGVLFLGKSEMLTAQQTLFRPIDIKHRVFARVERPRSRPPADPVAAHPQDDHHDLALDAAPVAQIVVDGDGTLSVANQAARRLFALEPGDVGRPVKDLELSYRPVELRSVIQQAVDSGRGQVLRDVSYEPAAGGPPLDLEVQISPLLVAGVPVGTAVAFADVTVERVLRDDLARARAELGNAYEELQSTVEELETTNEELQSANEELETTNEELQATNEELETMNEELQATNEELEAMNAELRGRASEVHELNTVLETILTAVAVGVAVVDRRQRVRVWNQHAAELWGLRPDEAVGEALAELDIGLPLGEVTDGVAAVLTERETRSVAEVRAVNRRGREIDCQVTALPLRGDQGRVTGAVVLMQDLASPQASHGASASAPGSAGHGRASR